MTIKTYVAKMIWNDHNYTRPSGLVEHNKSNSDFASKMGYGHEEWAFSKDMNISGIQNSFVQGIRKSEAKLQNAFFNLELISKNVHNGNWYHVATIKECSVIPIEEQNEFNEKLISGGIVDKFIAELKEVGAITDNLTDLRNNNFTKYPLANVRYKDTDLTIYKSITIDKAKVNSFKRDSNAVEIHFPLSSLYEDNKIDIKKHTRTINENTITCSVEHIKIQVELMQLLTKEKYIFCEKEFPIQGKSIDLLISKDNESYKIIEIKTSHTAESCIREAVGQLIQYSYLFKKHVTDLIIVGPAKMTKQDMDFLNHLNSKSTYKFSYMYYVPGLMKLTNTI